MARGDATEQAARTSFRDVFAIAEFRALWTAQLLSVVGDQLARVALTVLVYDRTRSSLLAAITFAVSIVPTFVGGMTLAWMADRYSRRGVMIACDLIRFVLGFAVGGAVVGFFGIRTSLLIDAVTFAVSALIVRLWVRPRTAPTGGPRREPIRLADILVGARLVLGRPALRTPLLFGLLAAFYTHL